LQLRSEEGLVPALEIAAETGQDDVVGRVEEVVVAAIEGPLVGVESALVEEGDAPLAVDALGLEALLPEGCPGDGRGRGVATADGPAHVLLRVVGEFGLDFGAQETEGVRRQGVEGGGPGGPIPDECVDARAVVGVVEAAEGDVARPVSVVADRRASAVGGEGGEPAFVDGEFEDAKNASGRGVGCGRGDR
jgi:hypothetical protein